MIVSKVYSAGHALEVVRLIYVWDVEMLILADFPRFNHAVTAMYEFIKSLSVMTILHLREGCTSEFVCGTTVRFFLLAA